MIYGAGPWVYKTSWLTKDIGKHVWQISDEWSMHGMVETFKHFAAFLEMGELAYTVCDRFLSGRTA